MATIYPLIFHRIGPSDRPLFADIDCDLFERMLDILSDLGGRSWSLADAMSTGDDDSMKRRWVLTFDDGWASDYHEVLPRLSARGWRATFFVVPGELGRPGRLGWSELTAMKAAGMEIGSHTVSHVNLTALPVRRAFDELARSRRLLSERLGGPIESFAFPGGYCSPGTIGLARKAGYRWIANSCPGLNRPGDMLVGRTGVVAALAKKDPIALLSPSRLQLFRNRWSYRLRVAIREICGEDFYLELRRRLGG